MNPAAPQHPNTTPPTPCGILLVDKDLDYTSMDVCAIVRSRLRRAGPHIPKRIKVGHAGTLDPLATGLLVVLVGKATRLCESFMATTKVYEATIDLAHTSATDDAEGQRTPAPLPDSLPTRGEIAAIIASQFTGTIMQRPPAFSAISVGGQRAYDLARRDKPLDLPPRPVRIDAFDLLDYTWPTATVRIICGKGTYIRSLARDLGAALGVGGMLTQLRRTRSGDLSVADALTLDALPQTISQQDLRPIPSADGQYESGLPR